jgi:VanZ family protein
MNRIVLGLHFLGWIAVLALVILSLVPGDLRPHTGYPNLVEHFIAYFGAAFLLTIGVITPRRSIGIVLLLTICAVAMEIIQNFVPGRDPAVTDALSGTFGAIAGALLAVGVTRI